MDDKLIIFRSGSIEYINGSGPDLTGANSQYSPPIIITSSVGCANPKSIVMTPGGIKFQSQNGIWLLGHDLIPSYVGAEVQAFNGYTVLSASAIPGTTQERFVLNNGSMLMFDYFVNQWGQFIGAPAISSTIYNGLHTIVDANGNVSQETLGVYMDRTEPVQMSFTTAWLQVGGLRGYQRAYFFFLLGTFITPHKIQVEVAYDYNPSPSQSDLITPDNYSLPYASDPYYGGDGTLPYAGIGNVINQRIFLQRQRSKAVQVSISEVYDPSEGIPPGAGLTLSGLSMMIGFKKSYAPISASRSVG